MSREKEDLVSEAAAAQAAEETAEIQAQSEEQSRKKGGGFFRFLFIGLIIGAAIALFSRRGGDEDEDFGEENWIEVKHEDTGSGAAVPTAAPASGAEASRVDGAAGATEAEQAEP